MPRRRKPMVPAWTPNQIVAHNITKARQLRGWTQDQAAEACAPYLGARLSPASWSALERSVDGGRIREITADELVAFARAFDVPIGFFLTPPSAWDNHLVATPDAGAEGLEPIELFDVVIGTPENLAAWEQYLLAWPSPLHKTGIGPDGTIENLGRDEPDVHPRLAGPAAVRARLLLREQFGDLDHARDVLSRLSTILTALDEPDPEQDDTDQPEPARRSAHRHEAKE
ncbi:MAG TPA: helix-turn-helix transcriptional regulator [Acidimicrobiales bacterium]|nr:helix-turn-helix transcriptional regulator [Acidimicrobiales bacterium]